MTVREELELIRKRDRGLLDPAAIVKFAKSPKTSLHSRFIWDDKLAGHEHRLEQARHLIRCHVVVLDEKSPPVRAYTSLPADRGKGGYRATVEVLSNGEQRQALLEMAFKEMDLFRQKFAILVELASVFAAMDQVTEEVFAKTT